MTEDWFSQYDRILVFDTETSGLHFERDEIIEFSGVCLRVKDGVWEQERAYDELIQLTPGHELPQKITELTGIHPEDLAHGITKQQLCADLHEMLTGKVLLVAYNAHFDLSFLFYLLHRYGDVAWLRGQDKLDLLTVFKDRHEFPHKLKDAITAYELDGKVINSHRAIDDVLATVEVMREMIRQCDDLECYKNLMGYNPKYGVSGKKIHSVTYRPQPYVHEKKLYEA